MNDVNLLDQLRNTVGNWFQSNAQQYVSTVIPPERCNPALPADPVVANSGYFRLTLCEMFLTNSRKWFTNLYPAVHSAVSVKFADRDRVEFSNVARPPDDSLARGVYMNYVLTDLLPYGGGTVEITASLFALQGDNKALGAAVGVLQDFAGLVAAPLAPYLAVAQKVSTGVQELIQAANGGMHLGWHQTFAADGSNPLRPGYFATLLTSQPMQDQLYVQNDRLHTKTDQLVPLTGVDYMLFKVESSPTRSDWRLNYIADPLQQAVNAVVMGDDDKADTFKKAALLAAMSAPDLTVTDRRRVVGAIKEEIAWAADQGKGAAGAPVRPLNEVVEQPRGGMGLAAAPARKGPLTWDEVFGS